MKKLSLVSLVMIAAAGFFFGVLTDTPSAQAADKVIELKLSTHKPPIAAPVKAFKEWAQKIEEATGGRVKIDIYTAASLVKLEDIIPATQRGICDIGDLVIHRERDKYPLTTILNLPFLDLGDPETGMWIWMDLDKKYPQMADEEKKFKTLYRHTSSAGQLHTAKKPARVPADLKGMKIIASGHEARVLKSIGASPLSISVPEWYSSLDRGLAEAQLIHYYGLYETKIYEHLPYHTNIGDGYAMLMEELLMSWDNWNKLPPDVQEIFDDLSPWLTRRVRELIDESIAKGIAVMKKEGQTFIVATPEEEKLWYEAALPLHKEWIDQLDAKGLPAKAIYEDALRLKKLYAQ